MTGGLVVKREEFIREIEENLAGKMTIKEIQDVIYDYNEYFDVGIREGKSEEEISGQWGSPARLVRTLLEEGHVNTSVDKVSLSHIPNSGHVADQHELDYAPLPNRMIALAIDTVIACMPTQLLTRAIFAFFMPFTPVPGIMSLMLDPIQNSSSEAVRSKMVYGVFALAFFVLYQVVCLLLLKGQTVGKLITKIKVVRLDGSPLRLTDILARETLGKLILNGISFGIASLVSFVWCLVSKEHKTVHDVIGGTRVVNVLQMNSKGK